MSISDDDMLRAPRARLLARGCELRERVLRVRKDLRRDHEPLPRAFADAAVAVENDRVLEAIKDTATMELAHIDHALARLDAGTFGLCERCGTPIDSGRLNAVPYATRCSACETRR